MESCVLNPRNLAPFQPSQSHHLATFNYASSLNDYVPVGVEILKRRTYPEWTRIDEDTQNVLEPKTPLALLLKAHWIQAFVCNHSHDHDYSIVRIYLLPDDVGRGVVQRIDRPMKLRLHQLMGSLDISSEAWLAEKPIGAPRTSFQTFSEDRDSLFYLFNSIPSPEANAPVVSDPPSRDAIHSLFDTAGLQALKTSLYPHQKRTAATMIQREVEPMRSLDPRLAPVRGPMGHNFYYDCQTGQIFMHQKSYEQPRGGILSESMGLGKTLITLATILATQGHWPAIPPEHSLGLHPVRSRTGSLIQMAAHAVGHARLPWRRMFREAEDVGESHENALWALEENAATYKIPPPPTRNVRRGKMAQPRTIHLCSTTLIIVPQNLLSHWQREIMQHFAKNTFKVLIIDSKDVAVPPADELMRYDIIFFSMLRLQSELLPLGSGKAQYLDCVCDLHSKCACPFGSEYSSPLLDLHFLRVIMDEGHEFGSGKKNSAYFAMAKLLVDRRWLLSGTPTSGLLGVEVGVAANPHISSEEMLEIRRKDSGFVQECKDLESLHIMITKYLNLKPWSNGKEEDPASWKTYIMPYQDGRRKPASLRNLLNGLCIRHRLEDIEADISLPPLFNQTVYLEPSWQDKLSQNAFIIALITNAVTSERVDEDYMYVTRSTVLKHSIVSYTLDAFACCVSANVCHSAAC